MEIRCARMSERDEVLDLLARWYDNAEFFARYNRNDPAFRDQLCLIAKDRGRLVSTVQIFDRKVNIGGQTVPMGGIGSVYTLAEYRKQGIASALMRLSVETMEREGFELSLLFADRLKFYGGFGWRAVARVFSILRDSDRIRVNGKFEIEPFNPVRDLSDVSAIYDSYSRRFDSTVVRDDRYWRGNLLYAGNPGEYSVVCAVPGGAIAAYARAILLFGLVTIMEYGYREKAEPAMLALFRHLSENGLKIPAPYPFTSGDSGGDASQEPGAAALPPISHTAHDPALERALTKAGCSVIHHQDNHFMWRVISPDSLGRRFDLPPAAAADEVLAMVSRPAALYWTSDRF
jgi:predicted N-acetyltransferase YhbS